MVFLEKQVEQFELVRGNITEILGPAKAANFVSKALFLISVGSNDLFDYAHNDTDASVRLSKEEYLSVLQINYYFHIRVYMTLCSITYIPLNYKFDFSNVKNSFYRKKKEQIYTLQRNLKKKIHIFSLICACIFLSQFQFLNFKLIVITLHFLKNCERG